MKRTRPARCRKWAAGAWMAQFRRNHAELTDLQELRFVELSKFDKRRPRSLRTPLERWLHVLKFGTEPPKSRGEHPMIGGGYLDGSKPLPKELLTEEGVDMAVRELRRANADQRSRNLMEQRSEDLHDEATRLEEAIEKGRDEGRMEGRMEGRVDARKAVAKKLLERGFPVNEIAVLTELSEEDVRSLMAA